jgi:hypothetical protein
VLSCLVLGSNVLCCCVVLCWVVLYWVVMCFVVVLCCAALCCVVLCCDVLYCVIVVSCAVLCCLLLCYYALFCSVVLYCVLLCCVVLCCVMLCRVMTITTDLKQSARELRRLSLNICPGNQTHNHKQYSERSYSPTWTSSSSSCCRQISIQREKFIIRNPSDTKLIVGEMTVCRKKLASSLASSIRKPWMRQKVQMALSVAE